MKWMKARKKPIVVEFREVEGESEIIKTLEGDLIANKSKSFIMRGVKGEIYPIAKDIFEETYEVLCRTCYNMILNSEEGMRCGINECSYQKC